MNHSSPTWPLALQLLDLLQDPAPDPIALYVPGIKQFIGSTGSVELSHVSMPFDDEVGASPELVVGYGGVIFHAEGA